MMTVTEICLLAWAILGMTVVVILLRFSGRRDTHGLRSNLDEFVRRSDTHSE